MGHNLFEVEIPTGVLPKVGPQGRERANLGLGSATSLRLLKGVVLIAGNHADGQRFWQLGRA